MNSKQQTNSQNSLTRASQPQNFSYLISNDLNQPSQFQNSKNNSISQSQNFQKGDPRLQNQKQQQVFGGGGSNEGKPQQIGIRASYVQKPPTDQKSIISQPGIYQKNMKYLEQNRPTFQINSNINNYSNNNSSNSGNISNTMTLQGVLSGGGRTPASSDNEFNKIMNLPTNNTSGGALSSRRENQVYRSVNSINQSTSNGTGTHPNQTQSSQQLKRIVSSGGGTGKSQDKNNTSSSGLNYSLLTKQQEHSQKSRNPSGKQINDSLKSSISDPMNKLQTLTNIPRSTTNKAFTSLQQKELEQAQNSSRLHYGITNNNNAQGVARSQSHSRGGSTQQTTSNAIPNPMSSNNTSTCNIGTSQTNSVRASQDIKSIQSQWNSNQTPKGGQLEKPNQSLATTASYLSRHSKVENQLKTMNNANMKPSSGGMQQQQLQQQENYDWNRMNSDNTNKSDNQARRIPSRDQIKENKGNNQMNMIGGGNNQKLQRPSSSNNQKDNKSTNNSGYKSHTHNPSSLQQLLKDAAKNKVQEQMNTIQDYQQKTQGGVGGGNNTNRVQSQNRNEGGVSSSQQFSQNMVNQLNQQQKQNQNSASAPNNINNNNNRNINNQIAKTLNNGKQGLKAFFEANAGSLNMTQKIDPSSGTATKVFTTSNVSQMIYENEEEDETKRLPLQPGSRIVIPNHEPTKCSLKRNGIVRAYAANTNQGLVRNYNEDRVSIILNIVKPENRKNETWPKCSFFGVYDGHGGHACAEFLRDNLHHFVIKEECFPWNPKDAIVRGFKKAEETFIEMCQGRDEQGNLQVIERSGSCAIVALIVGEKCYIANVGDSRAVLSMHQGEQTHPLSQDHKPSDIDEYKRIIAGGGSVYQTTTATYSQDSKQGGGIKNDSLNLDETDYVVGPIRVLPGRLSVSRTFGDPEAKLEYKNGNPKVVIADPDINEFQITKNHDYIILACDGIFDKMSNEDVSSCVWNSCQLDLKPTDKRQAQNVHQQCGLAVESVLKNSLYRQSLDNVTVVMIAFQSFKRVVFGKSRHSERSPLKNLTFDNNIATSSIDQNTIMQQEREKENINQNNKPAQRTQSASYASFLSQKQKLSQNQQNDENAPPHSLQANNNKPHNGAMFSNQQILQQMQQTSTNNIKPPNHPTSAQIQQQKNYNHLLNTIKQQEQQQQQQQVNNEPLKEKTNLFINRTSNNQGAIHHQQSSADNSNLGSRKGSFSRVPTTTSQVYTTQQIMNDNNNSASFLQQNSQATTPINNSNNGNHGYRVHSGGYQKQYLKSDQASSLMMKQQTSTTISSTPSMFN